MSEIEVQVDGAVRAVTLNRPAQRNALSPAMLDALTAAFAGEPDPAERVAVIRAIGPAFCAGLDLRNRDNTATGARFIERMLHAIEAWPLPVVAVVQGPALAGGCELALHCDVVVASTEATFGMPLAQIGLAPSWLLGKKLLETAGLAGTRTLLFVGDPLPAARMYELGAIAQIAEPAQLPVVADALVERIAANAPLALRAMKAVIGRAMAFRDAIAHADLDTVVGVVRTSDDAREGMAARLERRRPRFAGK